MALFAWWVTPHAAEQLASRLKFDVRPNAACAALIRALESAEKLPAVSDGAERWLVRVFGERMVVLGRRERKRYVAVTVITPGMAGLAAEQPEDGLLASLLATLPAECR